MRHQFTDTIENVIAEHFPENWEEIFKSSELLQYLNRKTASANRGSKARGSFANLYAIYVLVEDYINNGFLDSGKYANYEGAKFSDLFRRQRELPFGTKLQNHGLNHRMNLEFRKFFPTCEFTPIIRVVETNRYWINENLLKVKVNKKTFNLTQPIIEIIDAYIRAKKSAFNRFIDTCEQLNKISSEGKQEIIDFIIGLLAPNIDARIFEIVSYAILKYFYFDQSVFFGFEVDTIEEENLKLFKTGRTNANDGGIDFVMKPLGRFFQVTETTDVKKYFLDIDKLEKYPLTFVIKSEETIDDLFNRLKKNAKSQYSINAVVEKYMECIEEIINIPVLNERFLKAVELGYLSDIMNEIILQSKVEFNIEID
ncbi:MAG: restriction endonuclease [Bacteroidales bacterium]|nr:restriction endonuclease [Bacteroidales bacterium]MCF8455084.1 restriction endonuclease [Bacteroidales bacterium]